ncbi:MAG TPA: serine hydrolase domain-containing protein, partial [Candidatus Tumulicola sp.]|nr:serine hydrolase domain-containing protein [Candidatus Tumulicola sp.]
MKTALVCAAVALTCAAATQSRPAAAATVSASSPAVRNAIAKAVEAERARYGGKTPVPGVLIGVWDGAGGSYVRGFGLADVKAKRPMSAADHFRIGSNTKTFVVGVLLQLVDEGKLSLDDPLSRFSIGVTVPNAAHITVRELCNMRSGIFEAFDSPQFEHMKVTPDMHFDPRTAIGWAIKQK